MRRAGADLGGDPQPARARRARHRHRGGDGRCSGRPGFSGENIPAFAADLKKATKRLAESRPDGRQPVLGAASGWRRGRAPVRRLPVRSLQGTCCSTEAQDDPRTRIARRAGAIGENGAALLPDGGDRPDALQRGRAGHRRLRHRAGGDLRGAARRASKFSVFADETRPLLQGARLTAWELMHGGHRRDADLRQRRRRRSCARGAIDAVIVGADRIAANGDTANKIGTYTRGRAAPREPACRSTSPRRSPPST